MGGSSGAAALPADTGDTKAAAAAQAPGTLKGDALAAGTLVVLEAGAALGAVSLLLALLALALVALHDEVDIEVGNQIKVGSGEVAVRAFDAGLVLEIGFDAASSAIGAGGEATLVSAQTLEAVVAGPSRSGAASSEPEGKAVEAAQAAERNATEGPSTLLVGRALGRDGTGALVGGGIEIPVGCSLLQPQGCREKEGGLGIHYITMCGSGMYGCSECG